MAQGIFISYRRDTGSTMARMIYDRLRLKKKYAGVQGTNFIFPTRFTELQQGSYCLAATSSEWVNRGISTPHSLFISLSRLWCKPDC